MTVEKEKKIAAIVRRVTRPPKGQECWRLRESGGCTGCGGFGTERVLGCRGRSCSRTDHSMCGEKSVPCSYCAGTGLGAGALFGLLHKIGRLVGVETGKPDVEVLD